MRNFKIKWHLPILSGLLSVSLLACAEPPPITTEANFEVARKLRDEALRKNGAYGLIESLTTEVGARLAGSPEDKQAQIWAINQFKRLGFDKVWAEEFPLPLWVRGDVSARILGQDEEELTLTALGNSPATPADGIQAEVVAFDSFAALQKADSSQVKGKIVYISKQMQRSRDGSGYGGAVFGRMLGPLEAAKRGAAAILVRSIGTDNDRHPHTGTTLVNADIAPPVPAAALSSTSSNRLEHYLSREKPVTLELKMNPQFKGETHSANIIAEITGSEKPQEIVLISAHLDSWDLGTGAVDDGSGVAITMTAAQIIGDLPERPKRTIRVVLFGAEELGLVGSKAYAKKHAAEADNVIIATESDLGAGRIYRFSSHVDPQSLPAIAQIAKVLEPLGIEQGNNESEGGPDIIELTKQGVPVVLLEQDATEYFDIHHTAKDTLDKIHPATLNQNVAAYVAFTYLVANMEGDFGHQVFPVPSSPISSSLTDYFSQQKK